MVFLCLKTLRVRNLGVFLYSNGGEEMFKIDKKHFKGTKKLLTIESTNNQSRCRLQFNPRVY